MSPPGNRNTGYVGKTVRRIFGGVLTTLLLLAVAAAGLFAYMNRQQINDHFAAQRFEPSAEIVELTERLQLTSAGHRIFWASEPTLDASQKFNRRCAAVDHSEDGHILGCFTRDRIHLFKVADERLAGIVEVTAAHELLHAAFARIQGSDRSSLVDRLTELYEQLAEDDPGLVKRMEVYSSLSRTAFANELHSVLGTELRELPAWLEAHYAAWFEDRSIILDFFDDYHSVFDQLRDRSESIQAEMAEIRFDVETRSASYRGAVEDFNDDWADFMRRNNDYEFSDNPDEFYRLRDDFYDRRAALGAELDSINAAIAHYEQLRIELIELSELNQELEQQLDSDLAPPAPIE